MRKVIDYFNPSDLKIESYWVMIINKIKHLISEGKGQVVLARLDTYTHKWTEMTERFQFCVQYQF